MHKIIIKPNNSVIAKTVLLYRFFSSALVRVLFFMAWIIGLFSIILVVVGHIDNSVVSQLWVGISYIVLSIFLVYLAVRSFYYNKLTIPELISLSKAKEELTNEKFNLYSVFSFELAKSTYSILHSNQAITSREIAMSILVSSDINFILVRLGIGHESIYQQINISKGESDAGSIFARALDIAIAEGHHQIEVGDVFIALCELDSNLKKLIFDLNISDQDIANIVYWQSKLVREFKKSKKFFNPSRFKFTGGIGKDWAYGFTNSLNYYATDITQQLQEEGGLGMSVIGHNKVIKEITDVLSNQRGGNIIVVGEMGVGKRTSILGFADKVMKGETKTDLDFMHVFELHTDKIMADADNSNHVISMISDIFREAISVGNIIIFIENIQNIFSSNKIGSIDATEVMNTILDYPGIHIIGTCDLASFENEIAPNSVIVSKFVRVSVGEPSDSEMIRILEDTIPEIEYNTKSIISYESIKEAIKLSNKFIQNAFNPEKSIDLIEAVAQRTGRERGKTIILPRDVSAYITEKYDVPAGDASHDEKVKLLNLELIMHKSIIGQEQAVKAIADAMRRSRSGVVDNNKPIGSFLFLGPTGVGKTETAKSLANSYFGSENKMIRFDMSEYKSKEDLYRLIGRGEEQGALSTAVREHPFSLILFDEIEKASKDILDIFLQMIDEGFVTDGNGRKIIFSNSIIIATSNAGANLIRESINNGIEYEKTKTELMNFLQKEGIFKPEFLNRFTSVVAFAPLSPKEASDVTRLMISDLAQSLKANKGITLEVGDDAIAILSRMGYDPAMGARSMRRIIEEKIENILATKMLTGELNQGDKITITNMNLE